LRRYETILIAHVDLSEDELSSLIARYGTIVTGQKGILVKVERWGMNWKEISRSMTRF
jgi:ribosomal protein S6